MWNLGGDFDKTGSGLELMASSFTRERGKGLRTRISDVQQHPEEGSQITGAAFGDSWARLIIPK